MVRHQRGKSLEPEMRDLRQHLALARDAVRHDHVERRDAVARHEQKAVAQVEDLPDLSGTDFFDARQFQLK